MLIYHFHFVNVGRDRSRENFIQDPLVDARAQETVAANKIKRKWASPPSLSSDGGGAPAGGSIGKRGVT